MTAHWKRGREADQITWHHAHYCLSCRVAGRTCRQPVRCSSSISSSSRFCCSEAYRCLCGGQYTVASSHCLSQYQQLTRVFAVMMMVITNCGTVHTDIINFLEPPSSFLSLSSLLLGSPGGALMLGAISIRGAGLRNRSFGTYMHIDLSGYSGTYTGWSFGAVEHVQVHTVGVSGHARCA